MKWTLLGRPEGSPRQPSGRGTRSDPALWAGGNPCSDRSPVLLVILLAGATALSAASAAGAASGPQTFDGTVIADAAGDERHIGKSIVVAHGAFHGVGTLVEVPNPPADAEDIVRDDLDFAQGPLHLVTTNLGFTSTSSRRAAAFIATVEHMGEIVGGTGLFTEAFGRSRRRDRPRGRGSGGGRQLRAIAPTPHEVDRLSSTGTLAY